MNYISWWIKPLFFFHFSTVSGHQTLSGVVAPSLSLFSTSFYLTQTRTLQRVRTPLPLSLSELMALMAGSLPSTVSRLKLFLSPHPSIQYKVRTFFAINKLHQRGKVRNPLIWGNFRAPFSPFSAKISASKLSSHEPQMNGDDLVILGIETSCDDTAASVVRSNGEILSQVVASQICLRNMVELLLRWLKKLTQEPSIR